MPPKKPKLHQLAVEVPQGTKFYDPSKKINFILGKQFATGGFGRIYTCKEEGQAKELVVKVEPNDNGPLFTEIHVFQRILKKEMIDNYAKQQKIANVSLPWIISAGTFSYQQDKLRYMVMPKYETSLESVREKNGGTLSAHDTWSVALAMLSALEYLHHNKYVHADIKAANILLEKKSDMKTATLVDFGLARMVASNIDKPDPKRAHNGTAIFTSSDAHRGCNPSYRGDIEILGYNIIYWINGKLPWQQSENNPAAVFQAKTAFLSSVKTEVPKLIKSTVSVSGIQNLFEIYSKTAYEKQADINAAKKIVEKAISGSKGEKTESKPSSTKSSTTSLPKTRTRVKAIPQVDAKKEQEEIIDSPLVVRRRRVNKRPSTDAEEETEEKESLKENEATVKKTKIKPTSPSLKKNADQLRQKVPGLRNLPKGRRSIIVNKITQKYQKIARGKKDLNETPQ